MGIVAVLVLALLVASAFANHVRGARRDGAHASPGTPLPVASTTTRARYIRPDADLPVNGYPPAEPTLADLEFPESSDAPSIEGKLVAALLAGSVTRDRYRRAMHVLAARDERAHPDFPLPPVAC